MAHGKEAHSSRQSKPALSALESGLFSLKSFLPHLGFQFSQAPQMRCYPGWGGTDTNAVLPQDVEEWLRQSHGNTQHPVPSTWKDTGLSQNPCPREANSPIPPQSLQGPRRLLALSPSNYTDVSFLRNKIFYTLIQTPKPKPREHHVFLINRRKTIC